MHCWRQLRQLYSRPWFQERRANQAAQTRAFGFQLSKRPRSRQASCQHPQPSSKRLIHTVISLADHWSPKPRPQLAQANGCRHHGCTGALWRLKSNQPIRLPMWVSSSLVLKYLGGVGLGRRGQRPHYSAAIRAERFASDKFRGNTFAGFRSHLGSNISFTAICASKSAGSY